MIFNGAYLNKSEPDLMLSGILEEIQSRTTGFANV